MREPRPAPVDKQFSLIVWSCASSLGLIFLGSLAFLFTSCSDEKDEMAEQAEAQDAQILASLHARKEALLKNFTRTGDQFKHPTIYRHNEFIKGDDTRIGIAATSKGELHTTFFISGSFNSGIYVAIDEHIFFISFEYREGVDINDGTYSTNILPAGKHLSYKNLSELNAFLTSALGKNTKGISLKTTYQKTAYDRNTTEKVETLTAEKIEAFKQTLELSDVFYKISLSPSYRESGKVKASR